MHHRLQYLPDYFLTMFHFNLAVVAVARYINNDTNILFLNPEIHEFWARTVFLFFMKRYKNIFNLLIKAL